MIRRPRIQFGRAHPPHVEAAARGKRARDHLARKRERERQRLERARREQEIRQNRRAVLTVLTPLLFIGATALGFALAEPVSNLLLFRDRPLERVAVQGATALSPAAIAAGAGVLAGIPLDTIEPERIRNALANDPWIESARVLRLPTGTLVVHVVERQAVARWRVENSSSDELVDQRGSRFPGAIGPGGPLPRISGAPDVMGALPGPALEILRELKRYAPLASRPAALTLHLPGLAAGEGGVLHGEASGYVLELGRNGPRALLGERFLPQRVARLAALLEDDKAMVQAANLIDLRYADRAVLRTEPTSG